MRKDAKEYLKVPADSHHSSCTLPDVLFWLDKVGRESARDLMVKLLCWIGMVFKHGDWIDQAEEDSMIIPMLKGKVKSRAVEPEFKEAVSHMCASGELFRSGPHAIAGMHRFKLARGLKAFKTAHSWNNDSMARYLCGARKAMQGPVGRVISLAWDGTRLSGHEFLFSVMWANAKACVCPPMVPSRSWCCKLASP